MKKQTSPKIFDSILQTVKCFPRQASLEDILQALVPPVPRRSLQRYLAFLAKEGRIILHQANCFILSLFERNALLEKPVIFLCILKNHLIKNTVTYVFKETELPHKRF